MSADEKKKSNVAGRIWLVVMGMAFIGMGALIGWYLVAVYQKACRTDSWIEKAATIRESKIDGSQLTQHYAQKFRLEVKYDYQIEGKKFTGTKIRRLEVESASLKKVEGKQAKYPVGLETTCLVNPADPSEAILEADSKAAIYSIWFPGLFVVGGLGMVVAAIFRKPKAT